MISFIITSLNKNASYLLRYIYKNRPTYIIMCTMISLFTQIFYFVMR